MFSAKVKNKFYILVSESQLQDPDIFFKCLAKIIHSSLSGVF